MEWKVGAVVYTVDLNPFKPDSAKPKIDKFSKIEKQTAPP